MCASDSVYGKPYKKMVFMEETAPGFIQNISVGLQRVLNHQRMPVIFFLKPYHIFKKSKTGKRRFSALKGKGTLPFREFQ